MSHDNSIPCKQGKQDNSTPEVYLFIAFVLQMLQQGKLWTMHQSTTLIFV